MASRMCARWGPSALSALSMASVHRQAVQQTGKESLPANFPFFHFLSDIFLLSDIVAFLKPEYMQANLIPRTQRFFVSPYCKIQRS